MARDSERKKQGILNLILALSRHDAIMQRLRKESKTTMKYKREWIAEWRRRLATRHPYIQADLDSTDPMKREDGRRNVIGNENRLDALDALDAGTSEDQVRDGFRCPFVESMLEDVFGDYPAKKL